MSSPNLYRGVLGHILNSNKIENPVVQFLAFKVVQSESPRYRIVLSDGAYSYQCCIGISEAAEKIKKDEIDRFAVIRLLNYTLNIYDEKKVIIVVDAEILKKGSEINTQLFKPVPYGSEKAPPLSNFPSDYSEDNFLMDDDSSLDKMEINTGIEELNGSSTKKLKNNQGNASIRNSDVKKTNQLNPNLCVSIGNMNPYLNKWTIKGRVINKSNIRTWSNAKGEGKLFSFDLKDQTGEIRLTAFKAECDKFYDLIQTKKVVLVSKGLIKNANKTYSNLDHDYEITLTSDSIVEEADDDKSCPSFTFNFKSISSISPDISGLIDLIGVCTNNGEVQTIVSKKNNKELIKRDILLLDNSNSEIKLTLWGELATSFPDEPNQIIAVKNAKVSDYGGVSLSSVSNTIIEYNPQVNETFILKGWYDRVKNEIIPNKLSTKQNGPSMAWGTLDCIRQDNAMDQTDIQIQAKAFIYQTGKPNLYKSCMNDNCFKKVIDLNNAFYKCDKCNSEFTSFKYRIILNVGLTDHTNSVWAQLFHEDAQKLLPIDITELGHMSENNPDEFEEVLSSISYRYCTFKLKSRMEHYNDNNRLRTMAQVSPLNYVEYGHRLINLIKA